MFIRFGANSRVSRVNYLGMKFPRTHLKRCVAMWMRECVPQQEWVHQFVHTLDTILSNWYVELDVHKFMGEWNEMA